MKWVPRNSQKKLLNELDKMTFLDIDETNRLCDKESPKSNNLVHKICMFLQKETTYCRESSKLSPGDPSNLFLATSFTQK